MTNPISHEPKVVGKYDSINVIGSGLDYDSFLAYALGLDATTNPAEDMLDAVVEDMYALRLAAESNLAIEAISPALSRIEYRARLLLLALRKRREEAESASAEVAS